MSSSKTLSIRDIAKRCGVSPGTVSNVINGRDVVKPETASRIRALMNELNYAPKTKAVNTNRVMVLIPPHPDALLSEHLSNMHAGVCEAAFTNDIILSVRRCPEDLHSANQLRDMLREDGSIGVILLTSTHGYHLADTIGLAKTPHMVVGASRHQQDINQIVLDDETSAYRATRYLQELGHERISMVYFNRKDIGHAQRYVGFAAACQSSNMDKRLLEGVEADHARPEFGADALRQLMQCPKPPTAIIVTNAALAHGVISQAKRMNLSIPGDLSLIVYHSSRDYDHGLHDITIMKTPAYDMGYQAIQSVRQLLLKPEEPETSHVTLEMSHTLEVRQSTDKPRID